MKRVEIIGAAIVDVLVSPAEEEVFQTGSYAANEIKMTHGGDALNEATVLQQLGVPVHLETVIGSDTAGETVCRHMENAGLEESGLHIKNDMSTSVNVVLVKKNGERCFLTNPHGSQRQIELKDITMPFPREINILCLASIFVFPKLKTEELQTIFSQAKSQGITVCADMTKRKNNETVEDIAPALKYVDYLFPNEEEAFLITGKENAEEAADTILAAGVGTVVIKCGARGCLVKNAETKFWSPAVENVNCVDTTGAGDSFVGGFLYGLANDFSLEECAKFANECGAKAVQKVGAISWLIED
ncbi:MAG: carbohydrate kinase family protein [Schaedlerella sp.]|nr:carbohydrate kinase family protein [Schaedlerella sp.]